MLSLLIGMPQLSSAQLNTSDNSSVLSNTSIEQRSLPAEKAFQFESLVIGNKSLQLQWQIAPGHYLYRDKFTLFDSSGHGIPLNLPVATIEHDEFFGESFVYFNAVQISIPLAILPHSQNAKEIQLTAQYQGCAKDRYCYPLQEQALSFPNPFTP